MKSVFMLCSKEMKSDNGHPFTVYYGYQQQEIKVDGETHYEDVKLAVTLEDGTTTMKAVPVNVKLAQDFEKEIIDSGVKFPLLLFLDSEVKIEDKDSYYVTIDKTKDKAPRLDKYGKKHLILVVRHGEFIEAPRKTYDIGDIATFQG